MMRWPVVTIVLVLVPVSAHAQRKPAQPTLREQVQILQDSLSTEISSDSGPVKMDQIIARTDVLVRVTLGPSRSMLSADERDIYTTFEVVNPKILAGSISKTAPRPGEVVVPLTISVPGGTVPIGRFTATVRHNEMPALSPGMDLLVLLHREGDKYWPASDAAIFSVVDSKIVPLKRHAGEHQRFAGRDVESVSNELVGLKKNTSK
jgi:hypothetical protein